MGDTYKKWERQYLNRCKKYDKWYNNQRVTDEKNIKKKIMRNYIKYRKFVLNEFKKFIDGEIDNKTLNKNLHTIQNELGFNRQRGIKCVWFVFNNDEKLSFFINRIWSDIHFNNKLEYFKELMQSAINKPKDFKIYYS